MGSTSAKLLKTRISVPLILTLSIIPDADIFLERVGIPFLEHRGVTHSVVVTLVVFVPFFAVYRKVAVPYFLALISHALMGDYLTGNVRLLWPLMQEFRFGVDGYRIDIRSPVNIALEWTLFVLILAVMMKSGDILDFFRRNKSNLILAVPIFTVLMPTFLSVPLEVPLWLVPPHISLTLLFFVAILIEIRGLFKSVF